ncbi:MAG: response regulator transcription factor [Chitinophagaceae bacterium]|nr:response regulator transcription factor [Chitinophagaceae bacterium]
MFKAVIVDDDPRDREVLEELLKKYCSQEIWLAAQAGDIDSAYRAILEHNPEIVFLDVELGAETGFDLLNRFSSFNFAVIFVTAYERYAMQAIKFNALDYLLKPVEIEELVKAVVKVKTREKKSVDEELKNLIQTLAHPHQKSNRIAVPVLNGYKMIAVQDIMYCEAQKEYTYIYCQSQMPICSSINLGEYEDFLTDYGFCRVHHSYLVNRDHVKQYIKGEGGELLINKDVQIPVSRRKKSDVADWLNFKK